MVWWRVEKYLPKEGGVVACHDGRVRIARGRVGNRVV